MEPLNEKSDLVVPSPHSPCRLGMPLGTPASPRAIEYLEIEEDLRPVPPFHADSFHRITRRSTLVVGSPATLVLAMEDLSDQELDQLRQSFGKLAKQRQKER